MYRSPQGFWWQRQTDFRVSLGEPRPAQPDYNPPVLTPADEKHN
jgi:hypothetical protein